MRGPGPSLEERTAARRCRAEASQVFAVSCVSCMYARHHTSKPKSREADVRSGSADQGVPASYRSSVAPGVSLEEQGDLAEVIDALRVALSDQNLPLSDGEGQGQAH